MQYFVYILYSKTLDKYYIGSSADVEERLKKHNHIHKGYTAAGQPWIVVYSEGFSTKTEALVREKHLKAWKNRSRIESLIKNFAL